MSSSRLIVKMGQRPGLSTSVRKDSAWQVPTWDSSSWKDPPPPAGRAGESPFGSEGQPVPPRGSRGFPAAHSPSHPGHRKGPGPRGRSLNAGGGSCLIYPATPDAGSPHGVTSSRIQGRRGRRLGFRFASSCTPLSPLDKGTVWQSGSKRTSLPPARIHVASRKESGARGGGAGQLEYS